MRVRREREKKNRRVTVRVLERKGVDIRYTRHKQKTIRPEKKNRKKSRIKKNGN